MKKIIFCLIFLFNLFFSSSILAAYPASCGDYINSSCGDSTYCSSKSRAGCGFVCEQRCPPANCGPNQEIKTVSGVCGPACGNSYSCPVCVDKPVVPCACSSGTMRWGSCNNNERKIGNAYSPSSSCQEVCCEALPPTPKYRCSGVTCTRDDINGTYTSSDCNNQCTAPPTKYKCSGSSCVADPNGTYTTSNCNNQCSASPPPSSPPTPIPTTPPIITSSCGSSYPCYNNSTCSRTSCSGSGEDRECHTEYYPCCRGLNTCPASESSPYGTYPLGCCSSCGSSTYQKACKPPTCPSASGYPLGPSVSPAAPCGTRSARGAHGGVYQCKNELATPDSCSSNCHANGEKCWQLKTCAEINLSFPDEFMIGDGRIFVPDAAGNAGVNGFRCGKYYAFSPPWWQAAAGNVYAGGHGNVYATATNLTQQCLQANPVCSPYIIRSGLTSCAPDPSAGAGLAMSSSSSSGSFRPLDAIANRPNSFKSVAAYPAFDTSRFTPQQKQDYSYFTDLLSFDRLPSCGNLSNLGSTMTNNTGDGYACKLNGNTYNDINLSIVSGKKIVVFVDGDIKFTGTNTQLKVDDGGFFALIINGNLTVAAEVGIDMNNQVAGSCSALGQGQLQGLFIAQEFIFEHSNIAPDPIFNGDAVCDRKLILEGSWVSWAGDVKLERTFKGCGTQAGGKYFDHNQNNPAETFIYRPDLLINASAWLKQPIISRLEAN